MRVPDVVIEQLSGSEIGELVQPADQLFVVAGSALVTQRKAFVHADDACMPGERHSVRAQRRAEPGCPHGAIVAVARRLFAAPNRFDGAPIQLLGNRHGLAHVILISAPAESPSQEAVVKIDVFHGQAGYFRSSCRGFLGILRTRPNIHAIRGDLSSAVEWLHHRMVQIRNFVHRLDHVGSAPQHRFGVALFGHDCRAGFIERRAGGLEVFFRIVVAVRTLVPFNWQKIEGSLGAPIAVGDDRYTGFNLFAAE
jgi:hypothetical protein